MTGKRATVLAAAAALAAHLIYMGAAGPASAMQIIEAVDHAELAAEISATGVNRIALSHDRIRRVIRAPGGFETEHDPETGDLWLRPMAAGQGAAAERSEGAPAILFIGTEKGFTYRLTLTPTGRESAQILIRNGAALARAEAAAQTAGADPRIGSLPRTRSGVRGRPRVAALVGLVRAVARREPLPGYAIHAGGEPSIPGLTFVETWRGPRFAVLVFEAARAAFDGADGAADLAGTMRAVPGAGRVAALWLAGPGSGPSGGRLAVIVIDAADANGAIPADGMAGGPQ